MKKKVIFKSKNVVLSFDNDEKVYYIDDKKLVKKDDSGEDIDYDKSDFDELITRHTAEFINQKFNNVVVLFGAGASVTNNKFEEDDNGIAKAGVTVAAIAEKVLKNLSDKKYKLDGNDVEVFSLNELARISKYSDDILKEDSNDLNSSFNLENFLSNLFAFKKFANEEDLTILDNTIKAILETIIKATSYSFNKNQFNHIKLLNILASFTNPEMKLNLVTTNYDTLIEEAAESMKWTVFDGFSFSKTPQFDSTMFDWNLVKDVPNLNTNEKIYKNDVVNLWQIARIIRTPHVAERLFVVIAS